MNYLINGVISMTDYFVFCKRKMDSVSVYYSNTTVFLKQLKVLFNKTITGQNFLK